MVREASMKLTGLPATRGESFPDAILSCPLVYNQKVGIVILGSYGDTEPLVLPVCYPTLQNESRKEKTGPKHMAKWQPGESGNPKGRPPKRLFDEHLKQALTAKRSEKAKLLVEKLIAKASTGNVAALKLVCERVGGKPKPSEPVVPANSEATSLQQVREQLAALLAHPEVRRNLEKLMQSAESTGVVQ